MKMVRQADMKNEEWHHVLSMRPWPGASGPEMLDTGHPDLYRSIAMQRGPFVLAQVGQSLDGRVATLSGDAKDVSGANGIQHLHRCRALVDVVIVGVGTVAADDPSLSVRAVPGNSPVRAVIDCNGRMPLDAKMLSDGGERVLVFQADDIGVRCRDHETVFLPRQSNGEFAPADILAALGKRGLTKVLVEGGAKTIARFIDAGLVDRLHIAIAPVIIGSGPAGINLPPIDRLSDARRPRVTTYDIGSDIIFDCDLRSERMDEASAKRDEVAMADTT